MYVASASVRVPWVVIDSQRGQSVIRRNKAMSKRIKWGLEKFVFFFISLTHMTWGIKNKMMLLLLLLLLQI